MPKVVIDQKLAETLKTMRIERGILAKALAEKLGKSASYISKLENGSLKSVDYKELITYLQLIAGKENEDYIEELIRTAHYRFSTEEIANLLWMDNFDLVYRKIPVPSEFITEINRMMNEHGISIIQLVDQINKNEFIPEAIRKDEKQSPNIWFMVNNETYIKMLLSYEQMENVLNGKTKKKNFVFFQATVLYLFRLIIFRNVEDYCLAEEQRNDLSKKTKLFLDGFKIYTSTKKRELINAAQNDRELEEKLSKHDAQNMKILKETVDALSLYSEYDVEAANRQINNFRENMDWDSPFIMQIAGMPFSQLGNCSYGIKQDIINQIKKILDDALKIPPEKRRLEKYQ